MEEEPHLFWGQDVTATSSVVFPTKRENRGPIVRNRYPQKQIVNNVITTFNSFILQIGQTDKSQGS